MPRDSGGSHVSIKSEENCDSKGIINIIIFEILNCKGTEKRLEDDTRAGYYLRRLREAKKSNSYSR